MKIISNQVTSLNLCQGKCNFLLFESSTKEFELRQLVKKWTINKLDENDRFFIVKKEKELLVKDVELLELYGGNLEKIQPKLLQQWLKYKILNEDIYFEKVQTLQLEMEKFCLDVGFEIGDFEVEILPPEQMVDSILKVCSIEVNSVAKSSTGSYTRLTFDLWSSVIFSNKPKLVIYYYPENDGMEKEAQSFLRQLEEVGITTICFTKSVELSKNFPLEQTYLIKENGDKYDIKDLHGQISSFFGENYLHSMDIIELAYRDFMEQFNLLDEKYMQFLLSSRF